MTEKNYNPQQRESKTMQKQEKAQKMEAPVKKEEVKKKQEVSASVSKEDSRKEETKSEEKKKPVQKKEVPKKDYAVVNGISLPISTKTSAAICRFIKGKTIEKAIADLEEVTGFRKVIPMKGEIPHKKGKGIMSGRYPLKAISYFLRMLKTLRANAAVNGLEEPIVVEAVPNKASEPYARFGSIRIKRTHVKIKVMEKKK
jgi:ribosomal protein L22